MTNPIYYRTARKLADDTGCTVAIVAMRMGGTTIVASAPTQAEEDAITETLRAALSMNSTAAPTEQEVEELPAEVEHELAKITNYGHSSREAIRSVIWAAQRSRRARE